MLLLFIIFLLSAQKSVLVGCFGGVSTAWQVKTQAGNIFPAHHVLGRFQHATSSRLHGTEASTPLGGNNKEGHDKQIVEKLDFEEDYYSVLEVPPTVSADVLKKAFHSIVAKYHPDSRQSEEEKAICNEQMMVINNAYRILRREETRKAYDARRRLGFFGSRANIREEDHDKAAASKESSSAKDASIFGANSNANKERRRREEEVWRQQTQRKDQTSSASQSSQQYTVFGNDDDTFTRSRSSQFENDREKFTSNGRGDGSLVSLKISLKSLQAKRDALKKNLLDDDRDWGSVKDVALIQERLAEVEDLKAINAQIFQLENEIERLSYPTYATNKNGAGERRYDPHLNDNPYEPQTQPQRQKGGTTEWNRLRTKTLDPREGRLWRDSQRQYRNNPPPEIAKDNWNVHDFLNASEEYRNIADQFENFHEKNNRAHFDGQDG